MSGGGGVSTSDPIDIDKNALATFMTTESGKQYASMYNPAHSYAQIGDSIQYYDTAAFDSGGARGFRTLSADVSPLINAFKAWQSGNQQTQTNWQNYAQTVDANKGGQGDNTIITGAAEGQRQQLLGALAFGGSKPNDNRALGNMNTGVSK